jgi:sodium-dependent dicarboxylate transporter 2/3/5
LTWLFVPRRQVFRVEANVFKQEYRALGPMSYEEKVVLILFIVLAGLWLFRESIAIGSFTIPGWTTIMPVPRFIDDGTVAIFIAMLLFLMPARTAGKGRLMDWTTASKLHWGIVILFGGGFALAEGFSESGLSVWLGEQMKVFGQFSPLVLVLSICTIITFLTELTSNTALTQMILPILASLSLAINVNPLLLMIPATLSASCAFMLPVATPPNAIVFGTGEVRMQDMIKSGIFLNVMGVILVTSFVYLLGTTVFHIDLTQFPGWALTK